jgi:hypothetical protein
MIRLTIPVQIDSIKNWEGYQRTRCIYYRVGVEEGYVFRRTHHLLGTRASFAAGISWAALTGPIQKKEKQTNLFLTPESIDETIQSLHTSEELSLDLGYIWIPNNMFTSPSPDEPVREGDVYRLSLPYFLHCYRFSAGRIPDDKWLTPHRRFRQPILPSPQETTAFRAWRQEQIAFSRKRYHEERYAVHRLAKKRGMK